MHKISSIQDNAFRQNYCFVLYKTIIVSSSKCNDWNVVDAKEKFRTFGLQILMRNYMYYNSF